MEHKGKDAQAQIDALTAALRDEQLLERYVYGNATVTRTVIERYLRACEREGVPLLGDDVGASALPPVKRPKTLEEAQALAQRVLKG